MQNSLLTAILVAIIEPAELAATVILTPFVAILGKRRIEKDFGRYPHAEVWKAQQYVKFCLDSYGKDHPQTVVAYVAVESIIDEHLDLLDQESLDDYLDLGVITQRYYDGLTQPA